MREERKVESRTWNLVLILFHDPILNILSCNSSSLLHLLALPTMCWIIKVRYYMGVNENVWVKMAMQYNA